MAAYMDAKAASEAAAAATTTTAAVEARVAAMAAQEAAETAAMKAGEYIEMAVASAAGELNDRWHRQECRRYDSRCGGRRQHSRVGHRGGPEDGGDRLD